MTWQRGTSVLCSSVLLILMLRFCQALPQGFAYYSQVYQQPQLLPQPSNVVVLKPGVVQLGRLQQYTAAGAPVGQVLLVPRDPKPEENPEVTEKPGGPSFAELLVSFLPHFPIINPAPNPDETPEKPEDAKPTEGEPAKLEELEPESPATPSMPANNNHPLLPDSVSVNPDQRYILGQPQFFGNYNGLQHLGIKNLGNKGVIPNFLLVRGNPGVPHLGGKPEPEKLQDVSQPGSAALGFVRYLEQQKAAINNAGQAAQDFQRLLDQQKQAEGDQGAVVINADRRGNKDGDSESDNEEGENVEATDPSGPSVAQVKPQAIALAGPGGVAAAAPLGTALVGPGGLAVAAPAATAVAGPSGGAPPVVAPAQAVLAAYLKAHSRPYVLLSQ